jgi:hypothetical protein
MRRSGRRRRQGKGAAARAGADGMGHAGPGNWAVCGSGREALARDENSGGRLHRRVGMGGAALIGPGKGAMMPKSIVRLWPIKPLVEPARLLDDRQSCYHAFT